MRTGELNKIINISTITETVTNGDVVQIENPSQTVRAKVIQIDGSRYFKDNELIDRALFKIECWDYNYSNNIKITYSGLTLYPIRPITRNRSNGSKLYEITILAATKVGAFVEIETETDEEMKYLQTVNLSPGVETDITTTLTSEPYNLEFIDSAGNVITTGLLQPRLALSGGVYHVYVYSTTEYTGVKLKIIY